jgi:hypothetical protein
MQRKTFWKTAALTALLLASSVRARQSDRAGEARLSQGLAPAGCSILAYHHEPGARVWTRTLVGDGPLHANTDLREVTEDDGTGDLDRRIDAVAFSNGCAQYYTTPFVLRWDLDRNGGDEPTGSAVPSADGADGARFAILSAFLRKLVDSLSAA